MVILLSSGCYKYVKSDERIMSDNSCKLWNLSLLAFELDLI